MTSRGSLGGARFFGNGRARMLVPAGEATVPALRRIVAEKPVFSR
jgi:hypothetical protein